MRVEELNGLHVGSPPDVGNQSGGAGGLVLVQKIGLKVGGGTGDDAVKVNWVDSIMVLCRCEISKGTS